jgi:response regulator RpfG family c-di-GMP phosphodiesterase
MHNPNILVVDDSPSARYLVRELLRPMGADIEEAENGREGLDRMTNKSFDLVITDVDMPVMTGLEFCRRFKNMAACRSVPAVMISSHGSERDVSRGYEEGVEAYIAKDKLKTKLLRTVRGLLSNAMFRQNRVIMVVDHSVSVLSMLENGLARAGFEVVTAFNGNDALGKMEDNPPDLVISELEMPEMNGIDLCRAIKSDERFSAIPFVVMSTREERGQMKEIIHRGAASYIIKPFNLDQLVILVEKLLSDHVALLLKDRERLELERSLMLGGITSLISALEARDVYTRGHSEAVARILSEMVALTGAGEEAVEMAHMAGRLHDIGKIGVPDSILLKPDRLNSAEFEKIKNHPSIGMDILKSIPSLSQIIPVVHLHHERWDGGGYPLGLKGEKIPLWVRFTSVADTYHALTSDRPYRNGMPEERALEIIRSERERQFCPEAVDMFFFWYERACGGGEAKNSGRPDAGEEEVGTSV